MLCILTATSAALMGVLMPARGDAIDDVNEDLIFLLGEGCANLGRDRREGDRTCAGWEGTCRRCVADDVGSLSPWGRHERDEELVGNDTRSSALDSARCRPAVKREEYIGVVGWNDGPKTACHDQTTTRACAPEY